MPSTSFGDLRMKNHLEAVEHYYAEQKLTLLDQTAGDH